MSGFTQKKLKVENGSIYTEDGAPIAKMDRSEEATKAGISPVERDINAKRFVFLWNQAYMDPFVRRVKKVCANCGSEEVKVDAFAYWNIHTQEWDKTEIFPPAFYCDRCEKDDIGIRDIGIDDVPLEIAVARDNGTWDTVQIDVPCDIFEKYEEGLDISNDLRSMIDGCVFAYVYHVPSPDDTEESEEDEESS